MVPGLPLNTKVHRCLSLYINWQRSVHTVGPWIGNGVLVESADVEWGYRELTIYLLKKLLKCSNAEAEDTIEGFQRLGIWRVIVQRILSLVMLDE